MPKTPYNTIVMVVLQLLSATTSYPCKYVVMNNLAPRRRSSCVPTATRDLWERLFNEGYEADVCINTDDGGIVYAHSNIITVASSVLGGMLKQADRSNRR